MLYLGIEVVVEPCRSSSVARGGKWGRNCRAQALWARTSADKLPGGPTENNTEKQQKKTEK